MHIFTAPMHPLWDSWDLTVETLLDQLVSATEAADRATERYLSIYICRYVHSYMTKDIHIEKDLHYLSI